MKKYFWNLVVKYAEKKYSAVFVEARFTFNRPGGHSIIKVLTREGEVKKR